MFKLYFLLFYEFMKIGIFAIGGGYAALPFLYHMQETYNWFGIDELTNMIAVSNITPGPIGINMATYTGFTTASYFGALTATVAIVFVPFFLSILITKLFSKFQNSNIVSNIFIGLRPAACALLASIAIKLLINTLNFKIDLDSVLIGVDIHSLLLFILLIVPFSFFKKNPLMVIIFGAVGGIIIKGYF